MPWLAAIPALIGSVGSAIGGAAGALGGAAASAGGALASGATALPSLIGQGATMLGALGGEGGPAAAAGGASAVPSFAGPAAGGMTTPVSSSVPAGAGAVPNFATGAEAAKLSSLGQPIPQGVSMAGPGEALAAPEASQMFGMRPGLPSSEVGSSVPPSFSVGGPAGNKLAGMLQGINETAEKFNPILQLMSMIGGQGGGQQQDLTGTGGAFPLPNFQPLAPQVQEDPLAFLRAFDVQG